MPTKNALDVYTSANTSSANLTDNVYICICLF